MSSRTLWVSAVLVAFVIGAGGMWWWNERADAEAGGTPSPDAAVSLSTDDSTPTAMTPTAEETAGLVVPAALSGTWCTRSGGGSLSGPDGDPCFSFADLQAEYPDMTLVFYDGEDPGLPAGVQEMSSCLKLDMPEMDLGDSSCSMASSMYFAYFPAGVPWDCATYAASDGRPGCDPDFTDAHDTSQPRLLIRPNHQQDEMFVDSEPMYREP